jgi:YggT family protein
MAVAFHVLNAAKILVIADALLSWVMGPRQFPRSLTRTILEPVYEPLRSIVGVIGPVDLTPLVALGLIFALELVLKRTGHREPR